MTDGIDWEAAEEVLYEISKQQFTRFLGRADKNDLYGFGFFCDPIEGVMPVANIRSSHDASYRGFVERFGETDEETFRWDIGNWEYPAGLASSTVEQIEFDAEWERFGGSLSKSEDDRTADRLEDLCVRVLRRLCDEGAFSDVRGVEGFIVLGPDDWAEVVLAKKGWILSS